MILNREPIDIDKILNKEYTFYAHTKNEKYLEYKKDETIGEHINRCISRFKDIIKMKRLEPILHNFLKAWLPESDEEEQELFWDMLLNIISFHDIGKINPIFQKDKMNNIQFSKHKGNIVFKSHHAIISSIFYIQYYLPKSNDFLKNKKLKFRLLTLINAYIISKHHGTLSNFDNFINFFINDYKDYKEIICNEYKDFLTEEGNFIDDNYCMKVKINTDKIFPQNREDGILLYTYSKLIYSLLIASDYYATTEYSNDFIMDTHGNIEDINEIMDDYNKTKVVKSIRKYQKESGFVPLGKEETNINVLRNELFLEAENELVKNIEERVHYIEAPTGGGKSNIALNLSFKLIERCKELKKIWYIYPFNTLIEQNKDIIEKIFDGNSKILDQIRVVNSITPIGIKGAEERKKELELNDYAKALLDRQFFNYPITLSTHVTLFDILFGQDKESGFGFYQLANSVIVLDEIQSYRNQIWTEIIVFLKKFAELLNIKVIIMSATLPDLDLISEEQTKAIRLIKNRDNYFLDPIFKDRVVIDYELMDSKNIMDDLVRYIKMHLSQGKKVLVEFIKKSTAKEFYKQMINDEDITCKVRLITGDDNSIERKEILNEIEHEPVGEAYLLIATQVIEAGVDLNSMDVGFKDISMLDSEEQFIGRINRSWKNKTNGNNYDNMGKVYFFNLDKASTIYGNDVRIERNLTLQREEMRGILENKKFDDFYNKVLEGVISQNKSLNEDMNLEKFFREVCHLNFDSVSRRMKLINEEKRTISVFLARDIYVLDKEKEHPEVLHGKDIWEAYEKLLSDNKMDYAKKKIVLSSIKSQMSYFIYEIPNTSVIHYTEQVGELYYLEDGEQYFENGKFYPDKLINPNKSFI